MFLTKIIETPTGGVEVDFWATPYWATCDLTGVRYVECEDLNYAKEGFSYNDRKIIDQWLKKNFIELTEEFCEKFKNE